MRSRASSGTSTSSSVATPAELRKLAGERRASSANAHHRRQSDLAAEKAQGSAMKLVQLALLGLFLALVVPFVRSQFSNHASQVLTKGSDSHPDVFDFKHDDYLSKRNPAAHKAKPEDEAVVPVGPVHDLSATRKLSTASTAKPSLQQQNQHKQRQQQRLQQQARKAREQQSYDDDETQHTWSLGWLAHVLTASVHLLTFLSIPFRLLYRSLAYSAFKGYFSFRWGLSHTLRPVAFGLAPLLYLFSGLMYIFVQAPLSLLTALVTEFYPLYLFLGAASVIGITLGLLAAAVLFISSFVFTDREHELKTQPITPRGKGMRRSSSSRRRRRSTASGKRREQRSHGKPEDYHDDDAFDHRHEQGFDSSFDRAWVMGGGGEPSPNEPTPPSEHEAVQRGVSTSSYNPLTSPTNSASAANNYFQYPLAHTAAGGGIGEQPPQNWVPRRVSTSSDSPLASPAAYRVAAGGTNKVHHYPVGATARHGWGTTTTPVSTPGGTTITNTNTNGPILSPSISRTNVNIDTAAKRANPTMASSSSVSTAYRFADDTTPSPLTARKRRS